MNATMTPLMRDDDLDDPTSGEMRQAGGAGELGGRMS